MSSVSTIETPYSTRRASPAFLEKARHWHAWYWLAVSVLAAGAYFRVLGVGFLSDDLILLYQAQQGGIDPQVFVPQPHWFLYRPLGVILIWQVGWQLWGFSALPFHIQGLLLHAGVSLLIGLWLATVTGKRGLGWLAGSLFAVFPLHLEAVAWIAAQWDTLAAFFGLLSLWLFSLWWRDGGKRGFFFYLLSVALYVVAIFTKESMLAFLPMFALSAWLSSQGLTGQRIIRLAVSLAPFVVVLSINVGLRFLTWGNLGGYAASPLDYSGVFSIAWDQIIAYSRLLLSPLNSAVFGPALPQIAGILVSLLLVVGLIRYGAAEWRTLLVAAAWIVLALAPVLILPVSIADLENNRYAYLAAGGYCVAVATILHAAYESAGRWKPAVATIVSALLVCLSLICWAQLQPWLTASALTDSVEHDVVTLLPSAKKHLALYVENTPDNYQGAYLLRLGLGITRYFAGYGRPTVQSIASIEGAPLASKKEDAFALSFGYDPARAAYYVDRGEGITEVGTSPVASSQGATWDFSMCLSSNSSQWHTANLGVTCQPGAGLQIVSATDDPQLLLDGGSVPGSWRDARYLRIGVLARYPELPPNPGYLSQWFWADEQGHFSEDQSSSTPLRPGHGWNTYWTIIPVMSTSDAISTLRFDPVNAKGVPINIASITVEPIP